MMGLLLANSKWNKILVAVFLLQIFSDAVQSIECRNDFSTLGASFSTLNNAAVQSDSADAFIVAKDTQFGDLIEAASVDKFGNIFATDFSSQTCVVGQIDISGAIRAHKALEVEQTPFFKDSTGASFFNGVRFLPFPSSSGDIEAKALAADVNGKRVAQFVRDREGNVEIKTFCGDSSFVQPNDIAVAINAGRVYTSGQRFTPDTVVGDGDLWMCEGAPGFQDSVALPVKATRLGVFGRTNGIEVSPDEKTLYLSEAFNAGANVVSNKVWKFAIDPHTGSVWHKTLFVDFQQLDGSGSIDVDGMRTDVDGNLFITRNGAGEVVKFSPEGEVLLRINLAGINAPTNLEFGGPDGKSLFIVGACVDGSGKGCVNVWRGNSEPGYAFSYLNAA